MKLMAKLPAPSALVAPPTWPRCRPAADTASTGPAMHSANPGRAPRPRPRRQTTLSRAARALPLRPPPPPGGRLRRAGAHRGAGHEGGGPFGQEPGPGDGPDHQELDRARLDVG